MPEKEQRPRSRWGPGVAVAAAAVGIAVGGVLVLRGDRSPEPAPSPPSTPAPAPLYYLVVDLRRVDEVAVTRRVDEREVRTAAQAVRETMAGVYGAGFVNIDQWQGGRFPELFGYFAGPARSRAHRDLQDLSLGRAVSRFAAVRPERARVNVRVMVGPTGHPLAAIAGMDFRAAGLGVAGIDVPIRHQGRYVLRRVGGRWLIVAYNVRGRLGDER